MRATPVGLGAVLSVLLLAVAGCPTVPPEFIAGGTGGTSRLGSTPEVQVLSPTGDLQVTGGDVIQVNWRVVATTNFSEVEVFFDRDNVPNNGNEIVARSGLPISATSALVATTTLEAGTYFVGVALRERNEFTRAAYAPGRLIVNQAPAFFFTAPRDNLTFDRTNRIVPRIDVAWQVNDPDSTVSVEIFLDPGGGNEIKLRDSVSQTGDSFSFDFPVGSFEAGTYRILARVFDGQRTFNFHAPGGIRLRSRVAGFVDLRDLDIGQARVAGAVFEGFNPRDNLGAFVSAFRDIDGDGFADFIMNSQFGKPFYGTNLQRTGVGEAYLVYGRAQRFSGAINVNSVGRLFRGELFLGPPEVPNPIRPSRGITSFTVLSDWDRDGLREFAFGVPFTDSLPSGVIDSFGYFRSGVVVVVSAITLRPDVAFPGGQAIDLGLIGNEDVVADIPPECPHGFVGPKAPGAPNNGGFNGFYRYAGGLPFPFTDRVGCRLSSNEFGDQFGETIATGDFDSIIIAAPNRDPVVGSLGALTSVPGAGVVTTYFASPRTGFYPWSNVNTPQANDAVGYGGLPDNPDVNFIPHDGPFNYTVGEFRAAFPSPGVRVFPENSDPCLRFESVRLPRPGTVLTFWSSVPGGRLSEIRRVGDLNSDGYFDMIIGHPQSKDGAGGVFIVLGRNDNVVRGAELQLEELTLPMTAGAATGARVFDGIRIVGSPGARLGVSQDDAGDFNGDGVPDVVIGSPLVNDRRGGVAVFFGDRTIINLTEEEIAFDEIPTRGLGVVFRGEAEDDLAGARVAGIGDFDGDGLDDILIAAPNKSVRLDLDGDGVIDIDRTNCGVVYLIYGSSELRGVLDLADVGTERVPGAIFIGRNSGDFLGAGLGEQGDRSRGIATAGDVDGDGRRDLLLGAVSASPRDRVAAGEVYLIYGE